MSTLQLKNKIIKRIIEIDDIHLLKSLESIFNNSDKSISNFLAFSDEKRQNLINTH